MIEALEWKPCPFCGQEANLWDTDWHFYEYWRDTKGQSILSVNCIGCGVRMIYYRDGKVPYEDALKELNERWNRRTS